MRKRQRVAEDVFYSDGDGGTSANGTIRCTEDGELLELPELIGDEAFMEWRKSGDAINLKAKDHQRELGRWIVQGEEMKAIAGEAVDQRFKHSVYAAAADITGYTINTIKGFATVARNVSDEIMDQFPLSFAHFKLVTKFSHDPDKQRDLLSEILIGDLKVGQAREMIRHRTDGPKAKKSKADKQAERIIAHCAHILAELENYDLAAATPKLQEAVVRKTEETRAALKQVEDGLTSIGRVA
jgi:hypothetical protein